MKIQAWIYSFRLKTLPLSISGVILATALAWQKGFFSLLIAILSLSTILLLQILSNISNDLGDFLKGTDNENRIGQKRALQRGILSEREMKFGIIVCIILVLLGGISLLLVSCKGFNLEFFILFFVGVLGIVSAIKYTMGKGAYGYYGFGDTFVLLFFGVIPIEIVYFVQTNTWNYSILLCGFTVGLLSTSVLNLNNLRDYKNDKLCGKETFVVRIGGIKNGKIYHNILIIFAFLCSSLYTTLTFNSFYDFTYLLSFLPLFAHLIKLKKVENFELEIKKIVLYILSFIIFWSLNLLL